MLENHWQTLSLQWKPMQYNGNGISSYFSNLYSNYTFLVCIIAPFDQASHSNLGSESSYGTNRLSGQTCLRLGGDAHSYVFGPSLLLRAVVFSFHQTKPTRYF